MRDKNRIKPFLESIASLWEQNPDLRFGQLVSNVYSFGGIDDPFYIEDDYTLKLIESYKVRMSYFYGTND